jgi:hypothetical protein
VRNNIVSIRLSDDERARLARRAAAAGCTVSELIRSWVRDQVTPAPALEETFTTGVDFLYSYISPEAQPRFGVSIVWPDGSMGGTYVTTASAS